MPLHTEYRRPSLSRPDLIPYSQRDAWYGASLGGPLCDTSKMHVRQVRLASHESKITQKEQIT